jgi:5-(carboxyamino)imidazole ribonucleotide synthase
MLASALKKLGADVVLYDRDAGAPASKQFRVLTGSWSDPVALAAFAAECDVVTYEREHVDVDALRAAAIAPVPSLAVLETTQDRAKEKAFLAAAGLPHAAFVVVRDRSRLAGEAAAFGFPCIAKTIKGGYDGKGQWFLANAAAVARVPDVAVVLEDVVPIHLEVSCIVARASCTVAFPVFENAHVSHVLDATVVPARIAPAVAAAVTQLACDAASQLDVTGLLTTEFFIATQPAKRSVSKEVCGMHIYVNEFAPRPHNSGHVTRAACSFSQFDLLAQILLGEPLQEPALRRGAFAMVNVLSEHCDDTFEQAAGSIAIRPDDEAGIDEVMLYGKPERTPLRKLGHVLAHAPEADRAIERALHARRELSRS